jgi:CRISPR-associated protein Csd2
MTLLPAHVDPARKHDFVFLFDVRDGNPNGDPDAGGAPRIDPETGQGLVTDVAIKRKLRDVVALLNEGEAGFDIYVEAGVSLNSQHERAYASLGLNPLDRKTAANEARQWMCDTFFDVRMFGAVMSTGTKPAGRVQGPLQLTFSRSVDQVIIQEHVISRVTQTRTADIDKGESTELGTKYTIPYGLYVGYGHFSGPLARRTGVTTRDLTVLWRAFTHMFEHDRAAGRGEMALRGLYVFSHADAFGSAPAHALFDLVTVTRRHEGPARSYADYTVAVDEASIPKEVSLTRVTG